MDDITPIILIVLAIIVLVVFFVAVFRKLARNMSDMDNMFK